ncbi:MAG: hypothetical protein RIQ99_1978 [Pseudomonadota bacterium]
MAAAVLMGLSSVAAQAQTATAQDDLDCALWSIAVLDKVPDGEMKQGVRMAMIWLVGRWEGTTGKPIGDAINAESVAAIAPRIGQLSAQCPQRMMDFGARMQALRGVLEAAGK